MKIKQKRTRETNKKNSHTHTLEATKRETETTKSWFIKITSEVEQIIKDLKKQTHITIYSKNLILKHTNKQPLIEKQATSTKIQVKTIQRHSL